MQDGLALQMFQVLLDTLRLVQIMVVLITIAVTKVYNQLELLPMDSKYILL